jgi:hypothetical protein
VSSNFDSNFAAQDGGIIIVKLDGAAGVMQNLSSNLSTIDMYDCSI